MSVCLVVACSTFVVNKRTYMDFAGIHHKLLKQGLWIYTKYLRQPFLTLHFLPYASFFRRSKGGMVQVAHAIVNTQCILTPENVRLQVH